MQNKNFYKVYFTVIHTDTNGRAWKGEYVDSQYADTMAEAIKQTKERAHERKQSPDDVLSNFQAQLMN